MHSGKAFDHNMPKFQNCPKCNKNSKRTEKTATGAKYVCVTHGEFIVILPGLFIRRMKGGFR